MSTRSVIGEIRNGKLKGLRLATNAEFPARAGNLKG